MAFGDKISQGKNTEATGISARNPPEFSVWVTCVGSAELQYLGDFYTDIVSIAQAVILLYGEEVLTGLQIEPYKEE